jgi:hypothetical protein
MSRRERVGTRVISQPQLHLATDDSRHRWGATFSGEHVADRPHLPTLSVDDQAKQGPNTESQFGGVLVICSTLVFSFLNCILTRRCCLCI